jgi:Flp pilus assembly pilin Flp
MEHRVISEGLEACRAFLLADAGQDLVEYALLAVTIGIAGAGLWGVIAASLGTAYASYDTSVQGLWEPPPPPASP